MSLLSATQRTTCTNGWSCIPISQTCLASMRLKTPTSFNSRRSLTMHTCRSPTIHKCWWRSEFWISSAVTTWRQVSASSSVSRRTPWTTQCGISSVQACPTIWICSRLFLLMSRLLTCGPTTSAQSLTWALPRTEWTIIKMLLIASWMPWFWILMSHMCGRISGRASWRWRDSTWLRNLKWETHNFSRMNTYWLTLRICLKLQWIDLQHKTSSID